MTDAGIKEKGAGASSGKGKQEQAMRLMEALSGVDEELLLRAAGEDVRNGLRGETKGRGKRGIRTYGTVWRQARPWAAVLCLAVVGVLGWGGYRLTSKVDQNMDGGAANDTAVRTENCAPVDADEEYTFLEGGAEAGAENTAGQAAGAEEEKMMDDQMSQYDSDGNITADTKGADTGAGGDIRDHLGPTGNQPDYGLPGFKDESRQEMATEGVSGGSSLQGNSAKASDQMEGAAEESAVEGLGSGKDSYDSDGCPVARLQKMTEEEARGQELTGCYLPEKISRGYVFEEAFRNLDREEENLTMVWTRGMDFIQWTVVQEASAPETVDADLPESYDVRLYEIPWADSVPEKYRQSVDAPVFASDDLSLELVRSRMAVYEDQGDTDTPRGRFAVLYPDNYVVYFNGRGTAEEIWEMFTSIQAAE